MEAVATGIEAAPVSQAPTDIMRAALMGVMAAATEAATGMAAPAVTAAATGVMVPAVTAPVPGGLPIGMAAATAPGIMHETATDITGTGAATGMAMGEATDTTAGIPAGGGVPGHGRTTRTGLPRLAGIIPALADIIHTMTGIIPAIMNTIQANRILTNIPIISYRACARTGIMILSMARKAQNS